MRLSGSQTRRAVAARIAAAMVAGYAVGASAVALFTALLVPGLGRAEAVWAGTLPGFLIWAIAAVYAFAARSAGRAWAMLTLVALVLAGLRFLVPA